MDTYQTQLLHNSWSRCWDGVVGVKNDLLRDMIIWMYNRPDRHYHDTCHLIGCISTLQSIVLSQAQRPDLVELALWFHDVISGQHETDAEYKSFKYFKTELFKSGSDDLIKLQRICDYVEGLIRATRHFTLKQTEGTLDQQLICDIDLVTLGANKTTFDDYCAKIKKEYSDIDDEVYYSERIAILSKFINRGFIYRTHSFRHYFELIAVDNLNREIKRLGEELNNGKKGNILL